MTTITSIDFTSNPLESLSALHGTRDDLAWQDSALCAQTDPEAFFPEKGGSTRQAKKICAQCPVRKQCLDEALASNERFGVWGGMSEKERRTERVRRGLPNEPEFPEEDTLDELRVALFSEAC